MKLPSTSSCSSARLVAVYLRSCLLLRSLQYRFISGIGIYGNWCSSLGMFRFECLVAGVAVVHISYKNRTIHLKNHQRCNLKIIREKLKIPAEKFIIYDYPEVNYCLKTPCRTRLGFVYVNEEHSYVVKVAVVDAEESDFNEEDSLLISDYLKGTGTKTPEVARILLNHHPLMQDK